MTKRPKHLENKDKLLSKQRRLNDVESTNPYKLEGETKVAARILHYGEGAAFESPEGYNKGS